MRQILFVIAIIASCLIQCTISIHIRKDISNTISVNSGSYSSDGNQLHLISLKKIHKVQFKKRKQQNYFLMFNLVPKTKKKFFAEKGFVQAQTQIMSSYKSNVSTATHDVKLYNFKNVQYTGDFSIGTRGNTFSVIYDTGSANIWLNSIHCNDVGCKSRKQYDSTKSKSFQNVGLNLDVQFGTGELIGEMAQDTVYFGDVEVNNQTFVEIHEEKGDVFVDSQFDGIVGLAFPSMAAYSKNPLFDTLMEQKRIENNVFSFYMSPIDGTKSSEIAIGGANPQRYTGEIKYHDVKKEYYWIVEAQQILVDGQDIGLCKDGCYVIADTGTSLITGPSEDIWILLNAIPVDTDCSNVKNLPDLSFIIDGATYTLTGEEYVLQENSDGSQSTVETAQAQSKINKGNIECIPAFMPLDIPNDEENFPYEKAWILGDTFLQKYYSVYDRDNGRVGFALSKH